MYTTLNRNVRTVRSLRRSSYTQQPCSSQMIATMIQRAIISRGSVVAEIIQLPIFLATIRKWGQSAGQTFYLEFPPVIKDGQPFINSSPSLFPPLNDYACPRKPYYVDFAGVDDDGDSLVYSLVTPLSTHSSDPFPPPLPRSLS